MKLTIEYNVGYFGQFSGFKETITIEEKSIEYSKVSNKRSFSSDDFDIQYDGEIYHSINMKIPYGIIRDLYNNLKDIYYNSSKSVCDGDSLDVTFIDELDTKEEFCIIPCVLSKSYFKEFRSMIRKLLSKGYSMSSLFKELGNSDIEE